jgi:small subunit ribosomal protein S1
LVNEKQEEKKMESQEETSSAAKDSGLTQEVNAVRSDHSAGIAPRGPDGGPSGREEEEGEDFGAMFEESMKKREFDEGEIIKGVVVGVNKDFVMVDIGDKSEGHVPLTEFRVGPGEPEIQVGQEVEVLVERREDDEGFIRLSKDKAEKRRIWDELDDAYKKERPVKGKITEKVKGGLMVDVGVPAFLPGSQTDIKPIRNMDKLMGLEDNFLIIKFNRKRGNVVVSRRAVLEKDRDSKRADTLATLEKDKVVKGVVKNITEYGAFLDLGGIDGLLHITDMSYGRIAHPSEIMKVGDEITVKVLRFNRETEKVSLGLKQILPDPWDNVEKKYPVGTIVAGKVVSVTDYGAFVELERGVEGLVHVSEMNWSKKRIHPSKLVQPGEEVEAKVLDIDMVNRRISLSIKLAQPNPWDMLELKYPTNTRIEGKIRNITNFGVFVGVEEGIDGLVHISDLSWTKRVKHPSELFKKGQDVSCVVLKIDKDNERFSLGIKQAQPDPWERVPAKYRPGQDVVGKVVNITDFGVFVELEEGIEGLIHISELSHEKVKDPTELVQPGQEITAEILNVDVTERKIRLSVKALKRTEDAAAYHTYQKQEGDGTSKLGELIQDKLSKMRMAEKPVAKEEDTEPKMTESSPAEEPKESAPDETAASVEAGAAEEVSSEEGPDESGEGEGTKE